jgi:hypothetical protein
MGWIGVDLDGTLAVYDGWRGHRHIGRPVPAMVERVKKWLAAGAEVRILTARVSTPDGIEREQSRSAIRAWSVQHIGQALEVTNEKDYEMIELWDDRAIQVIPNTGMAIEEYYIKSLERLAGLGEAA